MKRKIITIISVIIIFLVIGLICTYFIYKLKYGTFFFIFFEIKPDSQIILIETTYDQPVGGGLTNIHLDKAKIRSIEGKKVNINDLKEGDYIKVTMPTDETVVTTNPGIIYNITKVEVIDEK